MRSPIYSGTIEREYNSEKDMIVQQHTQFVQELKDVMQAIHMDEYDAESDAMQDHEQVCPHIGVG